MSRARPPVSTNAWWPPGLLAVVLVLWLVADPARDSRERPAVIADPAWWFVRSVSGDTSDVAPPARVEPVRTRAATREAEPAAETDDAEVCGFGRVQRAPDDPDLLQQVPLDLRRAALQSVEARMLASPDGQVRAAALVIVARWGDAALRSGRLADLVHLAAGSRDATAYPIAPHAAT